MELRHLQTFVTVVESRSFTRAGQLLRITQAAVSKHIAALEAELNVALFERAARGITTTTAGQRFYEHARRILHQVSQAVQDLTGQRTHIEGLLRIAANTVPAQCLLPDLLAEFQQVHPAVRESVAVSDSAGAIAAVEQGEADVGLVGQVPDSPQLTVRAIADDELVLVVGPQHPLAAHRRITPQRLRQEPLIVRESGSGSRTCMERALDDAGLAVSEMTITMEMNSNDSIRQAVQRGLGVAFLSRSVIDRDVTDRRLIPIQLQGVRLRRQLYSVVHAGRTPSPAARAFLEFVESRGKPKVATCQ